MERYPKIQAIHKPEARGFDDGFIIVEEKVDGSQLRIDIDEHGLIRVGSNRVDNIHEGEAQGFKAGVDNALEIFDGVKANEGELIQIFGEYLSKPKQNALPYKRVPRHNFVIFDVIVDGYYLDREAKERFAFQYNLEVVPVLWKGEGKDFTDEIREELLKSKSFLEHDAGYDRIEGIVIKNYNKIYDDRYRDLAGKHMAIKSVNLSFQEKNKVENPGQGDKIENLIESLHSEARWNKAIQHLKEDGKLEGQMKDMALLAPAVVKDILEEEREFIKERLFEVFWGKIKGRAVKGLPEYYMKKLETEERARAI